MKKNCGNKSQYATNAAGVIKASNKPENPKGKVTKGKDLRAGK